VSCKSGLLGKGKGKGKGGDDDNWQASNKRTSR
jgi:hypothetical protein